MVTSTDEIQVTRQFNLVMRVPSSSPPGREWTRGRRLESPVTWTERVCDLTDRLARLGKSEPVAHRFGELGDLLITAAPKNCVNDLLCVLHADIEDQE